MSKFTDKLGAWLMGAEWTEQEVLEYMEKLKTHSNAGDDSVQDKCDACMVGMTQLDENYGCFCAMIDENGCTDYYVHDFNYCPECGHKNKDVE